LPSLLRFKKSKRTRPNAAGMKAERAHHYDVPHRNLVGVGSISALYTRLFGES